MRSKKAVEAMVRTKLDFTFDPPLRGQLLARALREQEQPQEMEPALRGPVIRRMIMRSPIVKLGIAAVVIVAVLIGLNQLGGSPAGVAWGEVAKKIGASPGLIYRERALDPNESDGGVYVMVYASPTHLRIDSHKGTAITRSIYVDCAARDLLLVEHNDKVCWRHAADDNDVQSNERLLNLKRWVEEVLSQPHTDLGRKTVDSVLCEGIETNYTMFGDTTSPAENAASRIWVSVETGYPVLCEGGSLGHDGKLRIDVVLDQFQWNVELGSGEFEPNIPAGYEQM